MTLTIDLRPETQVGLLALAEASGMSAEQYIQAMVENAVIPRAAMSPEERAVAWDRIGQAISGHPISVGRGNQS